MKPGAVHQMYRIAGARRTTLGGRSRSNDHMQLTGVRVNLALGQGGVRRGDLEVERHSYEYSGSLQTKSEKSLFG